ncbi:MAG: prolipoprotein diacylglyceryl transferase [Alphaproteobacteria bacterium]|nr:prolipoprotein diacylglyceryl transferase [Alphaproteobacteria bacterium]
MESLVLLAIPFPDIDPVLVRLGPIAIHWYAIAYLCGLLLGWRYMYYLNRHPPTALSKPELDDLLVWMMLGVVVGGRLGYVLFYNPIYYLQHPVEIVFLQRGGMSFHGGLLGVIGVMIWFSRRRNMGFYVLSDLVAAATPIGLFLGRIANFINGELFGRVTDAPWGVLFPRGGPLPRHPSQLYEAALEGLILFILLFYLARFTEARQRPGLISGVFLAWYGAARILVELVREPDGHIGYLLGGITMGQILSLPALLFGAWLIMRALRGPRFSGREIGQAGERARGKRA